MPKAVNQRPRPKIVHLLIIVVVVVDVVVVVVVVVVECVIEHLIPVRNGVGCITLMERCHRHTQTHTQTECRR